MDPNKAVAIGLTLLDEVLNLIKNLKAEANMTNDELLAHADAQDLQNKADIQALLAL